MASEKERRKEAKRKRDLSKPAGVAFRHRDGDRRRRGGCRVEDAIAEKQLMREFGLIPELGTDAASRSS